jgi:hypothetical protein
MVARKTVERPSVPGIAANQAPFVGFERAPGAPRGDNPASQLAQSLGQFSRSLQAAYFANQERQQKEADVFAQNLASTSTLEDHRKKVLSGEIAQEESPYHQAASERLFGQRLAKSTADSIKDRLINGELDPEEVDVEQIMALSAQDTIASSGEGRVQVEQGFSEVFGQQRDVIKEMVRNELNARRAEHRTQLIVASTNDVAEDAENRALPPEQATEAVWQHLEAAFELHHMSGPQRNEMTLAIAAMQAEKGREDLVKALLTEERVSLTSGDSAPALNTVPKYQAKAVTVLARAEKVAQDARSDARWKLRADTWAKAAEGEVSFKEIDALLADGTLEGEDEAERMRITVQKARDQALRAANAVKASVYNDQQKRGVYENIAGLFLSGDDAVAAAANRKWLDQNGVEHEVSVSDAMEQAYDRITNVIMADPGVPDHQKVATMMQFQKRMAYAPPEQVQILKQGVTAMQNFDPEQPLGQGIEVGYELWKSARLNQNGVLTGALSETQQVAYSLMEGLERTGVSTEQAVLKVQQALSPGANRSVPADVQEDLLSELQDELEINGFQGIFGILRPLVGVNMAGGMDADDAIEQAVELFKQNNTQINGSWVYTGGLHTALTSPDNVDYAEPAFERAIEELALTASPEWHDEHERLVLLPTNLKSREPSWALYDPLTGQFVARESGSNAGLPIAVSTAFLQQKIDEVQQARIKKANEAAARRRELTARFDAGPLSSTMPDPTPEEIANAGRKTPTSAINVNPEDLPIGP